MLKVELLRLQDELVQLDKSVSYISRAETLTSEVIASSREIQQRYLAQLQTIEARVQEFLEKALSDNSYKLDAFEAKQQQQLEALDEVLRKYVELGQRTEAIVQRQLDLAITRFLEFARNTSETTEGIITGLKEAHTTEILEMKRLSQAYHEHLKRQEEAAASQLDALIRKDTELLKASFEFTEAKVREVTEAQKKQTENIDLVFKSYVDLSDSTKKLNTDIRSVDFPTRLSEINESVLDFKNTVRNTFARIESVERNVAKVNQVDWKGISTVNELIAAQDKKLQRITTLLYVVAALAALSGVLAVVF